MGTFTGFSEDDIRKLQSTDSTVADFKSKHDSNEKGMGLQKGLPTTKRVTFKPTTKPHNANDARNKKVLASKNTNIGDVPENAKLNSKPQVEKVPAVSAIISKDDQPVIIKNNNTITPIVRIPIDVEEFEIKKKQIEEQNKRRKELLVQALAVKTKQTQAEAKKLEEIESEFKKLDVDLSSDVKILRRQIDIASVDYSEAQKRYLKVEKEFLEVKLQLQQRREKKELLTEHLCAIIEKNEERKAAKLTELLNKLQLQDDVKENSLSNTNNS